MNYYGKFKIDCVKSPRRSLLLSENCISKTIDVNQAFIIGAKVYGVSKDVEELLYAEEENLEFRSICKKRVSAQNILCGTDGYLLLTVSDDKIGRILISNSDNNCELINGMPRGLAIKGYCENSMYFSVRRTEFCSGQSLVSYCKNDLSLKWYFSIEKGEVANDIVICRENIYILFYRGKFLCLDKYDGHVSWELDLSHEKKICGLKNIDYDFLDRLFINNDIAVVCTHPGYFIGINLQRRDIKWVTELYATVKFIGQWDGGIVAIVDWQRLAIVDSLTGEVKKDIAIQGDIMKRILGETFNVTKLDITDTHLWAAWGTEFTSGPKGIITAINLETGVIDWYEEFDHIVPQFGQFFICNNRLYFSTLGPGLESPERRNYVLEGEGGYIPD